MSIPLEMTKSDASKGLLAAWSSLYRYKHPHHVQTAKAVLKFLKNVSNGVLSAQPVPFNVIFVRALSESVQHLMKHPKYKDAAANLTFVSPEAGKKIIVQMFDGPTIDKHTFETTMKSAKFMGFVDPNFEDSTILMRIPIVTWLPDHITLRQFYHDGIPYKEDNGDSETSTPLAEWTLQHIDCMVKTSDVCFICKQRNINGIELIVTLSKSPRKCTCCSVCFLQLKGYDNDKMPSSWCHPIVFLIGFADLTDEIHVQYGEFVCSPLCEFGSSFPNFRLWSLMHEMCDFDILVLYLNLVNKLDSFRVRNFWEHAKLNKESFDGPFVSLARLFVLCVLSHSPEDVIREMVPAFQVTEFVAESMIQLFNNIWHLFADACTEDTVIINVRPLPSPLVMDRLLVDTIWQFLEDLQENERDEQCAKLTLVPLTDSQFAEDLLKVSVRYKDGIVRLMETDTIVVLDSNSTTAGIGFAAEVHDADQADEEEEEEDEADINPVATTHIGDSTIRNFKDNLNKVGFTTTVTTSEQNLDQGLNITVVDTELTSNSGIYQYIFRCLQTGFLADRKIVDLLRSYSNNTWSGSFSQSHAQYMVEETDHTDCYEPLESDSEHEDHEDHESTDQVPSQVDIRLVRKVLYMLSAIDLPENALQDLKLDARLYVSLEDFNKNITRIRDYLAEHSTQASVSRSQLSSEAFCPSSSQPSSLFSSQGSKQSDEDTDDLMSDY